MLPPDQLSVPDKEDLRHCILFVHRKRNDILVLAVTVRNLLPLADPAHAVDQITVLRRLLEPHLLSRLRHFSSQLFDNVIVISIQKTDRLFDLLAVLFFGNVSLARRLTLVDVIVKTRAVLADLLWQALIAGTDIVQLPQQFDRIFHSSGARVRAEIFRLVLLHLMGKQNAWKILVHGHLNVRVRLVIFQHRIVFRTVLFDKVALQHERLQFGIRHNILKAGDMRDHPLNLRPFVAARLEILADTVFQRNRLSYVDNCIVRVVHQIDAGFPRQFFQFFLDIKRHMTLLFLGL